ncbi:MAG: metallophosphoesterase [Clostridia bacterium]|nr:metallophosphoesterase [Clostridia bacterium]
MRNLKKSLSLVLALALIISSVFVGGVNVSAALDLYTTINTYDDESDITLESTYSDTLQCPIINANDSWVYESFGSYGTSVVQDPLSSEPNQVVSFGHVKSKTNSWPGAVRIYTQGTETTKTTFSLFKPKANTTYEYEFRYYVKATNVGVDLQIRDTHKRMHGAQDEYKYNIDRIHTTAVTIPAGGTTNGWVTARGYFNTGSWSNGLGFFVASSTSGEDYNAEILVDDIRISECAAMTVYNYDGSSDKTTFASNYTTISDLSIPERDGYILTGIFSDAELNNKINGLNNALDYADTGVYYAWAKLNRGEYYCGFENYTMGINNKSYNSATTSIVSGNTYAGAYNIRVDAAEGSLNSFELRDKTTLETKAGTKYIISFQYRSTAAAKLYAGNAIASDVPGTAEAINGANLPAASDWTAASIEVTLNKGLKEGYVPALMVQAAEAAVVEFDHIYLTFPIEETQNLTNGFVTDTNWYPTLSNPVLDDSETEEPEEESQASAVWNKGTEAPTAGADGIYIIDTAEKLAYIIKNGGKMIIGSSTTQQPVVGEDGNPVLDADGNPTYEDVTTYEYNTNCTFKLTKDIYLNDITKYDWLSGVAGSGLNAWYDTGSFNGTIDGNFHTVYGLYSWYKWGCWHANNGAVGLIPEITNGDVATIKNLTIDYATVKGATNAGAFVGGANESTIIMDSCVAGENVYVSGYRAGALLGGSKLPKATIKNCASFATTVLAPLSSGNYDNASTGMISHYYLSKMEITNCFSVNGPICSQTEAKITAANCFESVAGGGTTGVTTLTKEQMQGKNVLKDGGAMAALNITANYWTATNTYPILTASTGAEIITKEIWDKTTQAPVDKNGDGIYEINSPKELAYVIYNGGTMVVDGVAQEGCSFILTRDIYLNDLSKYDWTSFTRLPWGQTTLNEWYDTVNVAAKFSGTIDGNNHSVYGVYSHYQWNDTYAGWEKGRGLIPSVADGKKATVKNLNLDCVFIHNEVCGAGAMVGVNFGEAVFENCSVGAKVYVSGSYAGAYVGANNNAEGVKLENCYSLATLHGYNDAGTTGNLSGLMTNNWMSTGGYIIFNNCYNANGPIAAEGGTITNSYATALGTATNGVTLRTAEQMKGEKALENMANLNSTGAYTLTVDLGYPALKSFVPEDEIYVPKTDDEEGDGEEEEFTYEYWDGTSSIAPTVGDGTEANPWHITNGAELYYVISNNGGAGVYYQLQNDIYLNDLSKINWQTGSIEYGYKVNAWKYGGSTAFQGNVDGNGYTVYGVYAHDGTIGPATAPTYSMGLFSTIRGNTTIKNLSVDYSFFHHEATAGGFIGCVYGDVVATIKNCYVGENVNAEANLAGGLIGAVAGGASVVIDNCYSLATSKGFIGSLYYNSQPKNITISNCYYPGKFFTNMNYTGTRTVTNCYEGVQGTACTGVTTVTADNMKGENALSTMSGLKNFVVSSADYKKANYNNFVYLPAGTMFDEDFKPMFFDTRMAPISADEVMFTDRMIRGAYVKFGVQPDVTKIHVPVAKAHRVAFGTAQELLASGYYDIETEIISENLANQPDSAVNYIFITDPHFDTQGSNGRPITKNNSVQQFALAIKMANEMDEIDFICLGGDLANGSYGTTDAWSEDLDRYLAPINECTKPVFVLVGNHDDNVYGSVSDSVTLEQLNARVMTNDKWQTAVIDKYINRTLADGTVIDVVQNEDPYKTEKINSKYFYYDLDNKNTRIICLNASDYEYAYDENGEFTLIHNTSTSVNVRSNTYNGYTFWGYSKYQLKWLAEEALGTLPEDYNVVVLSHMAIAKSSSGKETYHNGTVLSDIMAAYQNKTSFNHEDYGISADFAGDTGRIMAYQHGHEHIVYEKYNAGPEVWQFSSSTTNPHSGGLTDRIMNENAATLDIMSATEGYVFKQALGQGDSGMFMNNFPVYEGDVNHDTLVNICDLVKLNMLNSAGLATGTMPTADLAKMRKILLGE